MMTLLVTRCDDDDEDEDEDEDDEDEDSAILRLMDLTRVWR